MILWVRGVDFGIIGTSLEGYTDTVDNFALHLIVLYLPVLLATTPSSSAYPSHVSSRPLQRQRSLRPYFLAYTSID